VKKFAQQMIDAHSASTAKLKGAAASASPTITPDPTLTPDQQQKLTELQGKTGKDFDTAYGAAQVAAHQQALDALKTYQQAGDVAPLKDFAANAVPTVTAHLNMANGLPH
jgi:putative membrane protein